jgi:hypothetical protein
MQCRTPYRTIMIDGIRDDDESLYADLPFLPYSDSVHRHAATIASNVKNTTQFAGKALFHVE